MIKPVAMLNRVVTLLLMAPPPQKTPLSNVAVPMLWQARPPRYPRIAHDCPEIARQVVLALVVSIPSRRTRRGQSHVERAAVPG